MQVTPTIRNIYLYAVCFATLLMMVISFVQVADGVFGLLYPPPADVANPYISKEPPAGGIEQGRWEEQAKAEGEAQKKRERYYQVRQVVENVILFVVALPVYWYHWRKIEKDRQERG